MECLFYQENPIPKSPFTKILSSQDQM